MKSTVLIAALAAGLALTAFDASAAGRGGPGAKLAEFSELDTDGNGSISLAELEAAPAARFAAMDTDGNGAISLEELLAAREGAREKRAERMISHLDENEDGELQMEELQRRDFDPERMMSHLDSDENGEISEEEFDKAGRKGRGHKGDGKGGRG